MVFHTDKYVANEDHFDMRFPLKPESQIPFPDTLTLNPKPSWKTGPDTAAKALLDDAQLAKTQQASQTLDPAS